MRTSEANLEQATRFCRGLYGEGTPGYASVWTRQDRRTRYVEAGDPDDVAGTLTRLAETQDVYLGAGLQPRDRGPYRRGEGKDVIGIPGTWADIDVRGPAHADPDLPPSKEAALALVGEFPLTPTFTVDTGHGFQCWWLFKEPWIFPDEEERREAQRLVRRSQATLQKIAGDHGWRIDNTSDLARVMRPPGTWNRKLEPVPVRLMEVDRHEG
jgi:hypothetical protein